MVVCLGVVSMRVIVAVPVVVGVSVSVPVTASSPVVVCVVVCAPVCVHMGSVMGLGVVVHMVVWVGVAGSVCLVMAGVCVRVSVAVVSLSAQQVEFLLSLSSL